MKVIYDPKLEYAIGETRTYIKNDFVVSLTEKEVYDTLFLYTDLSKETIVNGTEIAIAEDHFFWLDITNCLFLL